MEGRSIVSVDQFTPDDLSRIFSVAQEMRHAVNELGSIDLLKGKILTNLFYEPSTRTSSSFMAAMQRLGGTVIPITEVKYSSVSKGETLVDTIRTLNSYSDCIALRHPQAGSAELAASVSKKPVINAGDGIGEHPTQALLDLFTIVQELGLPCDGFDLRGMSVVLLGDLLHGRTVHSLSKLLSLYGVTVHLVSPKTLRLPQGICDALTSRGCKLFVHENLEDVLPGCDVLYATRVQKERFDDEKMYESVKDSYVITPETMSRAKKNMVLMHPFPRVNEISFDIDSDPRAAYFRQMENGMYIRMALLAMVMGK
jgi:aspartate carbamoyltransferase catalytic subunit